MDLTRLFEVQHKLDAEIERKHPRAPGEDRLAKRILALQVELGELANEQRSWKFWSTDQEPRIKIGMGLSYPGQWKNPLLEEYVDCLHFILSIGLEISFTKYNSIGSYQKPETIENMFLLVNEEITVFSKVRRQNSPIQYVHMYYSIIFEALIALGEMLGFTWEQIESAYMSKNQINHERQANGY